MHTLCLIKKADKRQNFSIYTNKYVSRGSKCSMLTLAVLMALLPTPLLWDVRDEARVAAFFGRRKPDIIAAAVWVLKQSGGGGGEHAMSVTQQGKRSEGVKT